MLIKTTDVDLFINKYKIRKFVFEKYSTIFTSLNYFVRSTAYFGIEIIMLNVNLLYNKQDYFITKC